MAPRIVAVSELNEYVRLVLDSDEVLSRIVVAGEISGLKRHYSGHTYFTLKDGAASIRCALFAQYAHHLPKNFENGQQVHASGRVSLYPKEGQYQFYVHHMEKAGAGADFLALQALKEKLLAEGLFSAEHKKPIPPYAAKIAVVTSPAGAAVMDIIQVARRRNPRVSLLVVPIPVQGAEAPGKIAAGLARADATDANLIILARGGGSKEDLSAFNAEEVARAVFACQKPVISAVGHEVDFTLADFAADMRVPTPSAAAECAVAELSQLLMQMAGASARAHRALSARLQGARLRLRAVCAAPALSRPEERLQRLSSMLQEKKQAAGLLAVQNVRQAKERVSLAAGALEALSPLRTLARGYSVVTNSQGEIITSAGQTAPGEEVNIKMHKGEVLATVKGAVLE